MSLFGQTKRHVPSKKDARRSPLPIFIPDHEKKYDLGPPLSPSASRYFTPIYLPLPRLSGRSNSSDRMLNGTGYSPRNHGKPSRRYIRVYLPIPPRLYARIPRLHAPYRIALIAVLLLGAIFILLGFRRRGPAGRNSWTPPFTDPDSLVLSPEEVAMIWEWEISSGHYPSLQQREFADLPYLTAAPEHIPLPSTLYNPAVPESLLPSLISPDPIVAYHQKSGNLPKTQVIGAGAERNFVNAWDAIDHHPGFPSRPSPGTILDLDVVLEKCDLSTNKVSTVLVTLKGV